MIQQLVFMIDYLHDLVLAGFAAKGELSSRKLAGRGDPGNRGVLDLALFKFELRPHKLNTRIESLLLDESSRRLVRGHLESFDSYRPAFCYPNDTTVKNTPWASFVGPCLKQFVDFAGKKLDSTTFDTILKLCVKQGKNAADAMEDNLI